MDEMVLPVGDYAVVARVDVASNIYEGWNKGGLGYRWIRYESFPGQITLEISGARTLRIRPREDPAIVVSPSRGGGKLIALSGESVFHGESVDLTLWVPPVHAVAGETFELRVADGAGALARQSVFDAAAFVTGNGAVEPDWMRETIANLPVGIHALRFELVSNRCPALREILFWKGLRPVREGFGFECEVPLSNVDLGRSRGIRVADKGLALATVPTDGLRIALLQPPVVLAFARPGLTVNLQDESTGEMRPIIQGKTHGFGPDDARRLVIDLNDVGTWELLAGESVIHTFADGNGRFAQRVTAFFHEFGEVVLITARSPGGTRIPLLISYASRAIFSASHSRR